MVTLNGAKFENRNDSSVNQNKTAGKRIRKEKWVKLIVGTKKEFESIVETIESFFDVQQIERNNKATEVELHTRRGRHVITACKHKNGLTVIMYLSRWLRDGTERMKKAFPHAIPTPHQDN